jgi:hypothetical protein
MHILGSKPHGNNISKAICPRFQGQVFSGVDDYVVSHELIPEIIHVVGHVAIRPIGLDSIPT